MAAGIKGHSFKEAFAALVLEDHPKEVEFVFYQAALDCMDTFASKQLQKTSGMHVESDAILETTRFL